VLSGELPLLHDDTEESSWKANEFELVEFSVGDPSFFLFPKGKASPFHPLRFGYRGKRRRINIYE
jgi:hypothetical protein